MQSHTEAVMGMKLKPSWHINDTRLYKNSCFLYYYCSTWQPKIVKKKKKKKKKKTNVKKLISRKL